MNLPALSRRRRIPLAALVLGAAGGAVALATGHPSPSLRPALRLSAATPPPTLSATGLFRERSTEAVREGVLPFTPNHPLWTDGASKRRWIRIPDGTTIDARDPDAWEFPVGTRLWKEFAFEGRAETRFVEHRDDGWLFASYRWRDDGSDADLVPARGAKRVARTPAGSLHDIPSRTDCLACHTARGTPVLGLSALELSTARDPLAPHAEPRLPGSLDLDGLVARGLVRGLAPSHGGTSPRLAGRSDRERAALGWLHTNCGTCHATGGPLASLGYALDARATDRGFATSLEGLLGRVGRARAGHDADGVRLAPGRPEKSLLFLRVASTDPATRMPPLGTHDVDAAAVALLEAWIREDLPVPGSPPPPPPSRKD